MKVAVPAHLQHPVQLRHELAPHLARHVLEEVARRRPPTRFPLFHGQGNLNRSTTKSVLARLVLVDSEESLLLPVPTPQVQFQDLRSCTALVFATVTIR